MNNTAEVHLWGSLIGAVTWLDDREIAVFQYAPGFVPSGIQVAPLMMPLETFPYEFPALPRNTFRGLPGLLSDSLPDKFGNAVIDAWLAAQGRTADSFHPVERLCYVGARGMGALEFQPPVGDPPKGATDVDVANLVRLSNRILDERNRLGGAFSGEDDKEVIEDILRVGTSAGGARAKAVLAWNPKTNQFKSGQVAVPQGFEHWLMKFDGVANNSDKELADPQGFGKIELAYYHMAQEAGIDMSPCRIHEEGGRSHFMTRRFDRTPEGDRLHMQSLCAMAHYDYNRPDDYSHEQALQVMKRLDLPQQDLRQQVLRAYFNVVGRNHDDHTKNMAFLMDRGGQWRLSPAFDVVYSFQPAGQWTSRHQMSINGKRDNFTREDLFELARMAGIKAAQASQMLGRVMEAVRRWPGFAEEAKVSSAHLKKIQSAHRLNL